MKCHRQKGKIYISFEWWSTLSNVFFLLNILLALSILFIERKSATSTWAWIMLLFFLPVIGFILYLFFGKPLSRKKLKPQHIYSNSNIQKHSAAQLNEIDKGSFARSPLIEEMQDSIRMHLKGNEAVLTMNNTIQIYTDGDEKFQALFHDIENASYHIHLQYFIVQDDKIGNQLMNLLTHKAKQGVSVLFLYDDVGSKSLSADFFTEFLQSGGKAESLLSSKIPFFNLRFNYRNHRKSAVVDGMIGYIGGFNVGDEYVDGHKKLGYWRDTHLRVEGESVHALQNQFLMDWNQASQQHPIKYDETYFPSPTGRETETAIQIVASGPLTSYDHIKTGYLKLITRAKKSIYIQTPYFIPDDSILKALSMAVLSGVDVRIMIPDKPDHLFVRPANMAFVHELLAVGAKVYQYSNGFLHAKTLIIDQKAFSIGSANMDVRSFSLNFEANAFIYDRETAEKMARIFFRDVNVSEEFTMDFFESLSFYARIKKRIARLIAPLL
ncbi:cardiolipin synthetase 2 [Sinobaca qinghaiensis]|uniref:Cardiolipin synthase n=1 Tax=Sinobaca qinghaiensis TaxID=342944 RepID=A0A419UWZ0_9BACL|nr:cardiolipin synthetase 2 [Sinobaca qinghaiensis]